MKAIVSGVLIAVIGGVLTALLVIAYQNYAKKGAQVMAIQDRLDLIIVNSEFKSTIAKAMIGDIVHVVNVENSGNDDLENLKFDIVPSKYSAGIRSAGFIVPKGNSKEPVIVVTGSSVSLKYKLLRRGEGTKIWVITPAIEPLELQSDEKGLVLTDALEAEGSSFAKITAFAIAAASLVFFLIGVVLSEWGSRTVLKKIGLAPKEIAAAYADALARENSQT